MADNPEEVETHHSIADFINNFSGGTRVNRFYVTGTIQNSYAQQQQQQPQQVSTATRQVTRFHIKSATIPESIINPIAVNWAGRTINFVGDRSYAPWNIVVLDDTGTNNTLYKAFHEWQKTINDHENNKSNNTSTAAPVRIKGFFATSDWTVQHLDPDANVNIKKFTLKNCWPVAIGPLQLDMSQDNTIAAFAVSMRYSHYETPDYANTTA